MTPHPAAPMKSQLAGLALLISTLIICAVVIPLLFVYAIYVAVTERWRMWRHGPHPSPFVKERR